MFFISLVSFGLLFFITYKIAVVKFKSNKIELPLSVTNNTNKSKADISHVAIYFGYYLALWTALPAFTLFIILQYFSGSIIIKYIINPHLIELSPLYKEVIINQIIQLANKEISPTSLFYTHYFPLEQKVELSKLYALYTVYANIASIILALITSFTSVIILLYIIKRRNIHFQKRLEGFIKIILFLLTSIAVITTIGIVFSLFFEALKFFKDVSILKFLFGTTWAPENSSFDLQNSFGIIPLLSGTLLISVIAVGIAIIIGVSAAVYMSEYMPRKLRSKVKPILEILSGIPSIVYGFFAAITFAPLLVGFFQNTFGLTISSENALTAGIIMGIMLIPFLSSITDDVLNSIPNTIREGALGLGAMKNEVIRKILLPAAFPGIAGGVLLALSRAIGETMIVVMASSLAANLTFNPIEPVTTITTQIVLLVQGDQEFNTPKTLSAFALGFTLLFITLILNILALKIVNNYKKTASN